MDVQIIEWINRAGPPRKPSLSINIIIGLFGSGVAAVEEGMCRLVSGCLGEISHLIGEPNFLSELSADKCVHISLSRRTQTCVTHLASPQLYSSSNVKAKELAEGEFEPVSLGPV